uniref:AP2 domain-containing protein n=1 Tax=Anaerococcus mediterraneensis TaxID=1870984 RepID=UPI00093011D5|nr:AP2 domain-containing protein [Anaerococcus mediterraneensis]
MSKRKIKGGDVFGEWTVLKAYSSSGKSLCRCTCGVEKEVYNSNLVRGLSTSCGHAMFDNLKELAYARSDEKVLGKTFGELKVLKRASSTGESMYLCRCSCGKEVEVRGVELLDGKIVSCGHKRAEQKELKDKLVDGTSLYGITQGLSKNNSTGYKGVIYDKKLKKYRAQLTFNYKKINLGLYDTAEEAYQARLAGEEKYFKPILEKYKDKFEK